MKEILPYLNNKYNPSIIIANGENAAGGRGITAAIARELFELGIHGITLGNHTWDHKDIFEFIDEEERMVRPANYPQGVPGKGLAVIKAGGKELVIMNLQGRTFLPPLDCPFRMSEQMVEKIRKKHKCILLDFHAEATSEKIAMGWHLDGKVSAIVGTHTHIQTHDEVILPQGTAYVTDVGMVGSREGVLGMEKTSVLQKFRTQLPVRFIADEGKWQFHAVLIGMDEVSGKSTEIKLIRLYEDQFLMV